MRPFRQSAVALAVLAAAGFSASSFLLFSSSFAQGSITPTGAPGLTMKTLTQIEPRTDVLTLPGNASFAYIISQPGSYYLSASPAYQTKNGIVITAHDVTLDLNGFTVRAPGTASNFSGVSLNGGNGTVKNVRLLNGTVAGWGSIGVSFTQGVNGEVRNVQITECLSTGMFVGDRFTVTNCVARGNSSNGGGISVGANCVVAGCVAEGNSNVGFGAGTGVVFTDCVATANGAAGFNAGDQATVRHCAGRLNTSAIFGGIRVGRGSSVFACTAASNVGYGFQTGEGSVLAYCSADANTGDGFQTGTSTTLVGCNSNRSNAVGFRVGEGSHIVQSNAYFTHGNGIEVGRGTTVRDSNVFYGDASGIVSSGPYVVIKGNSVSNNGSSESYGIVLSGSSGLIEQNYVAANIGFGIGVVSPGVSNTIVRNTARSNTTGAYSIPGGNDAGPVGVAPTATSPFANLQ